MAHKRKQRFVEQCWAIRILDFISEPNTYGQVTWQDRFTGEEIAGIGYALVMFRDNQALLILKYEIDGTVIEQDIALQPTYPHYGGVRWWFTCPSRANKAGCGSRVGKLYLPRRESHFGCRACHGLAYRSGQRWSDRHIGALISLISR